MSSKRVLTLLVKEIKGGTRNYIFVFAVVAPILISLVISFVFGSWFTDQARLGIYDRDDSEFSALSINNTAFETELYTTEADLERAVENGSVDVGLVLSPGFDEMVRQNEAVDLTVYVWGESLAKHRVVLVVAVTNIIRQISGRELPLQMKTVLLGDQLNVPWNDRLLPFLVLMAVFLGGMMLPAIGIINEKQKNTYRALTVTPVEPREIYFAKGVLGILTSLVMGIIILLMNQAFGVRPGLLLMVLVLGALMAVTVGLIFGTLLKDVATLFTVWKAGGILLFAPAVLYMFPEAPNWVGYIFPTYYVVQPVVEISQNGGGWSAISLEVLVTIGIDLLLLLALALTMKKRAYDL